MVSWLSSNAFGDYTATVVFHVLVPVQLVFCAVVLGASPNRSFEALDLSIGMWMIHCGRYVLHAQTGSDCCQELDLVRQIRAYVCTEGLDYKWIWLQVLYMLL